MRLAYLTCAWPGARQYPDGRSGVGTEGFYVRQQHRMLTTLPHTLDRVVVVVNALAEDAPDADGPVAEPAPDFLAALDALAVDPAVGCPVDVLYRPSNLGRAYGAWSYAYGQYRDRFDAYITNEDDYVFRLPQWDVRLLTALAEAGDDVGHVCGYCEPNDGHAAWFNGILRQRALEAMWQAHGELIHRARPVQENQREFTKALTALGWRTTDLTDRYRVQFWQTKQVFGAAGTPLLAVPVQIVEDAAT